MVKLLPETITFLPATKSFTLGPYNSVVIIAVGNIDRKFYTGECILALRKCITRISAWTEKVNIKRSNMKDVKLTTLFFNFEYLPSDSSSQDDVNDSVIDQTGITMFPPSLWTDGG